MAKIRIQSGTFRMAASALVMSVALSACESVPDAINPVSWYDKTTDFFSGDNQAAETSQPGAQTAAGGNQGLSADPAAPPPAPVPSQQVAEASGGLSADQTQQGNYASPPIARQGQASNVLAPQSDPSAPPVPSAQPVSPVMPASPMPSPVVAGAQPPAAPSMPGTTMLTPPSEAEMASAFPSPPKPFEFPPVTSSTPYGADQFETVVISADGMSSVAPARPQMIEQVAEAPSGAMFPQPGTTTNSFSGAEMVHGMLRVATINFANNSASLDHRDRSILGAVIQLHRERGGRVVVIGHASSRTRDMDYIKHQMVNFEISMHRASSIGAQLQALGLDANALEIQAVADSQPMYLEVMPSGEAGNRRVEIYLAGAAT
ncbi:OmpA family protein [Magnetovibrio sp. PR-2]|uniref:OmpA family protein n=1 Tax=Magnetovibrio sp. PR-2 TaxID=3120356 RepID=UPI002FCE1FD4